MTYQPPQPPNRNGIMELDEKEILAIQAKLHAIQETFEPSEDEPVLSTHGLVSRFNETCEDGCQVNGDTAEFVLNWVTEETD